MGDTQQGDEVTVRLISRRRSGGQRCGIIVDVVERATNVFVGTYFEENDAGWVNIDGTNFNEPVWVGDPAHKRKMQNITIGGVWHAKVFGGQVPGPIWRDMMTGALEGREAPPFNIVDIPRSDVDRERDRDRDRDEDDNDNGNGDQNGNNGNGNGGLIGGGFIDGGTTDGGQDGGATGEPTQPDPTFSIPEDFFQGQTNNGGNGNGGRG